MAYSLTDVLNAIMTGIQDTLYYIATAISDNADVISKIVVVGSLAFGVMTFGTRVFRGVTSWVRGFF